MRRFSPLGFAVAVNSAANQVLDVKGASFALHSTPFACACIVLCVQPVGPNPLFLRVFLLRATAHAIDLSFPTIAGENSNGAIIHYSATPDSCHIVGRESMLLLDSGAQYEDGTTDVTRTMHFGEPTAEQKEVRDETSNLRAIAVSISFGYCLRHMKCVPFQSFLSLSQHGWSESSEIHGNTCFSSEPPQAERLALLFSAPSVLHF